MHITGVMEHVDTSGQSFTELSKKKLFTMRVVEASPDGKALIDKKSNKANDEKQKQNNRYPEIA